MSKNNTAITLAVISVAVSLGLMPPLPTPLYFALILATGASLPVALLLTMRICRARKKEAAVRKEKLVRQKELTDDEPDTYTQETLLEEDSGRSMQNRTRTAPSKKPAQRKKKISGGGGRKIQETSEKDSDDYTMTTIIEDDDGWER
ncbi:MAG: hypothetical protein II837_16700 [Treponema sp.]|nr:hypothetical protein [Treponema sp.]